jgi:hypothetical protein
MKHPVSGAERRDFHPRLSGTNVRSPQGKFSSPSDENLAVREPRRGEAAGRPFLGLLSFGRAKESKAGYGGAAPVLTHQASTGLKTRGFRPPPATYSFCLPKKSKQKKGTPMSPPACGGFPPLRRRFGDGRKLAALGHSPVCFPKRPLRSGGDIGDLFLKSVICG